MRDKDKIIIEKMIRYCNDSTKYIKDIDFETFNHNELYLTFSMFSLLQFGELVSVLSDEVKLKYDDMPWNAIKSIRNRIVHGYDGVQYRNIWDTLVNDIPNLIDRLSAIKDNG